MTLRQGERARQLRPDPFAATLLTTHYMEEAERLCDRVAIVDRGKVIALGTPRELIASLGSEHIIEFSLDESSASEASSSESSSSGATEEWLDLPSVTECRGEDGAFHLSVVEPHVAVPALLERLSSSQRRLAALTTRHASLDDVFVQLTGHKISEEGP